MKKSLVIWALIVIALAVWCDISILGTKTYTADSLLRFSTSVNYKVVVSGSNSIFVTATGDNYFRIVSGTSKVAGEPEPIASDNFKGTGNLPGGEWLILDGNSIDIEAISETPISVVINPTLLYAALIIILSVLVSAIVFILGIALTTN